MGTILLSGLVYFILLKVRSKSSSETLSGDIAIDISKVHDQSDNFELVIAPTEAKI
jgi:hypothetical protein